MNETAAVGALTCPVTGNPDLYGLGIRIGIYIQMLTVQLSGLLSCYFQTEDHICQGTVVFVLSTSIVLVRLLNATIQRDTQTPWIEPVEVFPVLSLLLIQVGVCRVSPQNQTTMLIWMVELVGLTVLFAWFWWHGMDLLPRSCPDDKAFFFAEVSIWNWFRSFNKAGSVFTAIGTAMAVFSYCGTIIAYCWIAVFNFIQRRSNERTAPPNNANDRNDQDDQDQKPKFALPATDLVVNIGAIVYVEVSLKWNNITDVHGLNSPGQFMPFFIALGQFLSVFYSATKYFLQAYAGESAVGEEDDSALECHHKNPQNNGPRDQENIAL